MCFALYSTRLGLLIAVLLCGTIAAKSAEPEEKPLLPSEQAAAVDSAPRRFQRLLVPADRPEDWPRDPSQHYLPMPADEFEQRLAELRQTAGAPAEPPAAPLVRANYTAELAADNTLRGKVDWTFEHGGTLPTTVLLGNCRLSLADFHWVDNVQAAAGNRGRGTDNPPLAMVGNDQNGRLAAVVDRAGTIEGLWSLQGERDLGGALSFALHFPACPSNELQLTLPADLTPTLDHGIVSAPTAGPESGQRRWQIQLGGKHQATVRIAKQDAPLREPAKTFVRQSLKYEFSPRGLELSAEFRLDVLGTPLRQIKLAFDRPLTMVRAQLGTTELPTSSVGNADNPQGNIQELTLDLPAPIQGTDQVLQLTAIAPLTYGTPWHLPLVQVKDAEWQTGKARLIVPAALVVDELLTEDCRQSKVETLPDAAPGEAISLDLFSDHAGIDMVLSRRREQVGVTQGTSIFLRANEGTGRYQGEFTVDEGERFTLEAEIAPQWIIENVESTPPGIVADWSQQLMRGRLGKLTVQLSKPLTPDQKVRLLITGRRRSAPWGETLHASDLAMLNFAGAAVSRRLIHVQAAEALQLQLRDAGELTRLDPAHLSPADAALLEEQPAGLVFVDDESARNLALSLIEKAPQFDAEIRAETLLGDNRLTESYRFSITPQGREVGRFDVRFSQPRTTPMTWLMEGEPSVVVAARRLTESEGSSPTWPGEVWEVVLPAPRATPFVLVATRSSPIEDDMPLALASLIEADTQRGTIQITSVAHSLPELHSRRLKAIPVEAPAADQYATELAAFRYDPEEDTLLTAEPPLVLVPHGRGALLPQAWIWQAQLESRYARNGTEHMLICQVENAGLEKIQFQPPAGAELRSASINGQPATDLATIAAGVWKINLPAGARFTTVVLRWSDGQALQGLVSSCAAPWPAVDVPILSRQWVVCTPPGMALADVQIGNFHPLHVPWTKRLFGPLARTQDNRAEISREAHKSLPSNLATDWHSVATEQHSTATNRHPTDSAETLGETVAAGKQLMAQPAGLQSPWKIAPEDLASDSGDWTNYRFGGSGPADRLWIADEQSLWSWSLFVVSVALRWWLGKRAAAMDIGLLGTATVVALLIPLPWAPLSAAVWLGLIAGRLMVWIAQRSQQRHAEATPQAAATSTVPGMATVACVFLFCSTLAGHGFAQADEAANAVGQAAGPQSPIRRVLIPVDHDEHPTGGLYYLPETFHDELLRATGANLAPPRYLIIRATYTAHGGPDSKTADLAGDWQAKFEIESLSDHTEVLLPLGFDGTALVPNGVQLDGHPAVFSSDDRRQRLVVELEHAGTHRLEVLLHPVLHSNGISFAVPKVAASQIDLAGIDPRKLRLELDSENASLKSRRNSVDRQMVELGSVDRIVLRPPETVSSRAVPAAVFDVDELYCLRIRPDSVGVDARFHLNVQSGSVQQLYLLADPRWQPAPKEIEQFNPTKPAGPERTVAPQEVAATDRAAKPERAVAVERTMVADGVAVAQVHPLPGDSDVWVIELARPVAGQATVDVSFQLNTDSGIGRWQPLRWSVSGSHAERRWWGVTIDPRLDFALSPASIGENELPEKFASLWPSRDEKPQIAWRSALEKNSWSIATWLREPKLATHYELAAIAGQKELELRLAAEVAVSKGQVFQYQLVVPRQMDIDSVSVREQHVVQPSRWSRSRPDLLTVFLPSPASGQRELLVRGRMPLPAETKFALPSLSVEGSVAEGFRALIFRRPEVLVDLADAAGSQSLPDSDFASALAEDQRIGLLESDEEHPAGQPRFEHGKLVAVLQGKQDFPATMLHVQQNQPKVRAMQVTTLSRSADAWQATVNLDLHIESGVVDTLRFDLPANWIGPFEISPAVPQFVEEVPGENRRQLVLRPELPLQHDVRLQISGPLTIAAGQRPSAPDVRLLGAMRQTRFFWLPRRLENQQLAWDTHGLIPRSLPEAMAESAPDPGTYRSYQLVGDRCRAELRSVQRSSDNPQVRLVDVAWSWDTGGGRGVAAFDLDPAGATSCELLLPPEERLIQAQLDAAPAQLSPLGNNHWNVWLGDNKLPRHLEVIFVADHLEISGHGLQLAAPVLVDLPVERTLWSIGAPAEAGAGLTPTDTAISPLRHQRLRLEGAAAAIDSATSLLLDESTDDVARWYTPWLRRFAACRADLVQAKSAELSAEEVQNAQADLKALDQDQAKLARKLNNPNADSPASAQPVMATDWLQLAALLQPPGRSATQAMIRGEAGALAVEYPQLAVVNRGWRFGAAAGIAALTIGLLLALRLGWLEEAKFVPGPPLLGMAAGIAWWLWLNPAVVGVAMVAISLFQLWKTRRLQAVKAIAAS